MRRAVFGWVATLFVVLAACDPSSTADVRPTASRTSSDPSPAPIRTRPPSASATPTGPPAIRLTKVADVYAPVSLAARSRDLYVADQSGLVLRLAHGSGPPRTVLDMTDLTEASGEQGLLGLAISPDERYLYVDYTDLKGDTNVDEYGFDGDRIDPSTRRRVLFVDQPFSNHNGGQLAFGPDGYLYIGLGDGGSGGDPFDNGQSLGTLLGKILRIDPRPSGGLPYRNPPDNPFMGRTGTRPEIWDFGLRNPWRFSFDRETHALWIADVGQGDWEEVDREPGGSKGGRNYGWNRFEGSHPFESLTGGGRPPDAVGPVYEYDHGGSRCSITGGFVYRGSDVPQLRGMYVFADFCAGPVMGLRLRGSGVGPAESLGVDGSGIASFGEDSEGELYALVIGEGVFRVVAA